jgi:hypothetical protein
MIAFAVLALAAATLPPSDQAGAPEAERSPIEKKSVTLGGIGIHFLTIPWGPNTFAAMEKGGDSFYAKRTWPFARMEAKVPVTIEDTRLPPGNYALVFHPNGLDDKGMSLEVRKIAVPEFLVAGNVMTKTPEGETVARGPAVFETVKEIAPALLVELLPSPGGATCVIRYGDRKLVKALAY